MGSLHELWRRFGDRVAFVVVYIREAHPEDGWVLTMNRQQDIAISDPTSDEERLAAATRCALDLEIQMPVVIDRIDDSLTRTYGALPDRLYLIGKGGHVAYQGAPGPFGFQPDELAKALEAEVARITD